MTDTRRKLSHEILRLSGICAAISLAVFLVVSTLASGFAQEYCFQNEVPMTEFDWIELDRWIFGVSGVLSCGCFSVLFLFSLGDRMTYIKTITVGIDALHDPERQLALPLQGNNELTALAAAVNDLSAARLQLREQELALAQEKDQLIRTLSHDIRTPLTAILSYSEYLSSQDTPHREQLELIRRKAGQIRELTDVLLDGSRRNPEHFDDGRLLMEQLVGEFEETLEDAFSVGVDLSGCPAFSGTFDVQELRRIFDNLSSNVRKYAAPDKPVTLTIRMEGGALTIRQSNAVLPSSSPADSLGIGLNSIRRIAQLYAGTVRVEEDGGQFTVTIRLTAF